MALIGTREGRGMALMLIVVEGLMIIVTLVLGSRKSIRKIEVVNKGEIGIPVIFLESYDIKLGDTVALTSKGVTKKFKVTAFVH